MLSIINIVMKKISQLNRRLGISACLLGQKVRFDGGHKRDRFLTDLFGKFVDWVPICPEVEVGMGVPRETVRLVGTPNHPRMIAEKSGQDWTEAMHDFAAKRVRDIAEQAIIGLCIQEKLAQLRHGARQSL